MKAKTLLKTLGLAGLVAVSTPNVQAQSNIVVTNWFNQADKNPELKDSLVNLIHKEIYKDSRGKFECTYKPNNFSILKINNDLRINLKNNKDNYVNANGIIIDGYNSFSKLAKLSVDALIDLIHFNENGFLINKSRITTYMPRLYYWTKYDSEKWNKNESKSVPVKDVLKIIGYDVEKQKVSEPNITTLETVSTKKTTKPISKSLDDYFKEENIDEDDVIRWYKNNTNESNIMNLLKNVINYKSRNLFFLADKTRMYLKGRRDKRAVLLEYINSINPNSGYREFWTFAKLDDSEKQDLLRLNDESNVSNSLIQEMKNFSPSVDWKQRVKWNDGEKKYVYLDDALELVGVNVKEEIASIDPFKRLTSSIGGSYFQVGEYYNLGIEINVSIDKKSMWSFDLDAVFSLVSFTTDASDTTGKYDFIRGGDYDSFVGEVNNKPLFVRLGLTGYLSNYFGINLGGVLKVDVLTYEGDFNKGYTYAGGYAQKSGPIHKYLYDNLQGGLSAGISIRTKPLTITASYINMLNEKDEGFSVSLLYNFYK